MRIQCTNRPVRRGAVAPLLALLLIPVLAMVAFSVDVGYLIVVRTELQNAADAAALAGVEQLLTPSVQFFTPGNLAQQLTIKSSAISLAKSTAQKVALENTAGGIGITLSDSEVVVGYLAPDGTFNSGGDIPANAFPNTVRVNANRDGSSNAQAPSFFAKVLGVQGTSVAAFAQASAYAIQLDGPSSIPMGVMALPMTYDVNDWNAFAAGNPLPNSNTKIGTDLNLQLQMYPSIKDTGNFGLLSLDNNHAGASTIRSWVNNGMTQSDLTALQNSNLVPLSSHPANTWDWVGNPGFKSSVVQDVNGSYIPGQAYLLPLFQPKVPYDPTNPNSYKAGEGQGSNYFYDIVKFVAVQIVSDPNDNRNIWVEPAAIVLGNDQTLGVGKPALAGQPNSSPSQSVFIAPALTQ